MPNTDNSSASIALNAYQFRFIGDFLSEDSAPFHQLIAPPGTGRTIVSQEIIRRIISEKDAKHVLVLTPSALRDHFAERLREVVKHLPVLSVDGRVFRELENNVPIGTCPWEQPVVAVMSFDFAKTEHVTNSLLEITWDLMIVDEAHQLIGQRKDVFTQLIHSRKVTRALLIPIAPIDPKEFHLENLQTSTLRIQYNYAIPEVKVVDYSLSEAETKVINGLMELLQQIPASSQANFTKEIFLRQTSSSLYALEQSLLRRIGGYSFSSAEVLAEFLSDLTETSREVETAGIFEEEKIFKLLESINSAAIDSKFNKLVEVVNQSILGQREYHLGVITSYRSTANYLNNRLVDLGLKIYQITGSLPYRDAENEIDKFNITGGLLIGTPHGLKGVEVEKFDRLIVHDLFGTEIQLKRMLYLVLTRARKPIQMLYVFREASGVLQYDQLLVNALQKT